MNIVLSVDQGQPIGWAAGVTWQEHENYYIDFLCDQEWYLSNKAAEEALKDFIIEVFNKV